MTTNIGTLRTGSAGSSTSSTTLISGVDHNRLSSSFSATSTVQSGTVSHNSVPVIRRDTVAPVTHSFGVAITTPQTMLIPQQQAAAPRNDQVIPAEYATANCKCNQEAIVRVTKVSLSN
jgi:hypothetical protein